MVYRVILTQNGKRKKLLYEGGVFDTAKKIYLDKRDNNKVLFPKKTNAYKKAKSVIYEILFVKEKEEMDNIFYERDELGVMVEVKLKGDKWTILYKDEYLYEEKFTVFGYEKRMETKEIIKLFLLKKTKQILPKQVNYINNKLLIHNDGDFVIVLCKCTDDASRLHNTLEKFCETNKIKNIMFTGLVSKSNRKELYKKIVNKTGWSFNMTYKTTTRP